MLTPRMAALSISVLLTSVAAQTAAAADKPPNFIVIFADDQGWGTSSVMQDPEHPKSRSDFFRTPNLQRLADRSMRFTDAYASHPNCSPSRAALLTGRSPAALHMTDIIGRNRGKLYEGNRVIPPHHISQLPRAERTIAELLKAHHGEYRTAHFGKWHLAGGGPAEHGFDAGDGPTGNRTGNRKSDLPDNPKKAFGITTRGIEWMQQQVDSGHPFYLQLSHYAVHLGFQHRPETLEKFQDMEPGERHQHVRFGAMQWDLDVNVGRVLDAVERLGLKDNTYVFYTSDNGTYPTDDPANINGPLRGFKASLWEGGVRVPFLVSGPGITPGSISRTPVVGYDILPTICDFAGIDDLPDEVEGGSLKRVVLGDGTADVERRFEGLFFHWPHYQHAKQSVPDTTLRDGRWKLHHWWETGNVSLYDLDRDLDESREVQQQHAEKAEAMRQRIAEYLDAIDAQKPKPNPNFDPQNDPARWRRGEQQVDHPQFD